MDKPVFRPMVPVFYPQNTGQLSLVLSLLEAHAVPHYVSGNYMGAATPIAPIPWYNDRIVMVPAAIATETKQLLMDYEFDEIGLYPKFSRHDKLRMVTETLIVGQLCVAAAYSQSDREYPSLKIHPTLMVSIILLAMYAARYII